MSLFGFFRRRPAPEELPIRCCIKVMPRETLRTIAEREYGDQEAWEIIFRCNRSRFEDEDPSAIRAGMELDIPEVGTR